MRTVIQALAGLLGVPALDNTTGSVREDADVADITGLMRPRVERCGWPKTLTFTVRRTKLAPGETPTTLSVQRRDARHRVHARVKDRVDLGGVTILRR